MAFYGTVSFNQNNLPDISNVRITSVVFDNQPEIKLSRGKLSRKDGVRTFNKQYGDKTIVIEGYITTDDREAYSVARGELLKSVEAIEKTLLVILGDTPLEYTATLKQSMFTQTGGGYAHFSLRFVCSDPFGRDRDSRTIMDGYAITTASGDHNYGETIGGTYSAPLQLMLTVASVTGGTDSYISLKNQSLEEIRITRDWVDDDQLVIDFEAKTLTVNGVAVDYTGSFWRAGVGDTYITYADNFTTRTLDLQVKYKRRYL